MESKEKSSLSGIRSFGENMIDAFRSVLSGVADTAAAMRYGFDPQSTASGSYRQAEATADMVSAFKDALSDMKIELDDDEVGRFVDKTVTRLVYS